MNNPMTERETEELVERLRKEAWRLGMLPSTYGCNRAVDGLTQAATALSEYAGRVRVLEGALKPFGVIAERNEAYPPHDDRISIPVPWRYVKNAASALSDPPKTVVGGSSVDESAVQGTTALDPDRSVVAGGGASPEAWSLCEPYVPVAIHFAESDTLEFVQRDVATVTRPVRAGLDVLLDVETREPIGWRIYGWSQIAPHPAESAASRAAVAQPDRAPGSEPGGRRFESSPPRQSDEWRRLEEAPRDGSLMIVCCDDPGCFPPAIASFEDGAFRQAWDSEDRVDDWATHWRPLPGPPPPAENSAGSPSEASAATAGLDEQPHPPGRGKASP
jgi:hypothetical protein